MFKGDEMVNIKKTETFIEHEIIVDGIHVGDVELCPERMEISRFFIFEPYRRKGYGTEVLKQLIDLGYCSLWVKSDNIEAIKLYERCGFVKSEETMFEMKYAM